MPSSGGLGLDLYDSQFLAHVEEQAAAQREEEESYVREESEASQSANPSAEQPPFLYRLFVGWVSIDGMNSASVGSNARSELRQADNFTP